MFIGSFDEKRLLITIGKLADYDDMPSKMHP